MYGRNIRQSLLNSTVELNLLKFFELLNVFQLLTFSSAIAASV